MMRAFMTTLCGGVLSLLPFGLSAFEVNTLAQGFDTPWAIEMLPNGALLVTERDGALIYVHGDRRHRVAGVPRVVAQGQGGLLDVTLPRDFAQTRDVFLTYSKDQGRGTGTALAVGQLSDNGERLENVRDLFVSAPGGRTGRHFGSRVIEGPDGTLFVTIGDRGDRPSAQDLTNHSGTIVRINRDGSIPQDNPFVGVQGAQPEIWSYGHRNPQGAGFGADGQLWTAEHGARGGDEVNKIMPGANYGWPVISYGTHYNGSKIGEGTHKEGMQQPEFYWDPSIAPSGLLVYSGRKNKDLGGAIFVGSLKFDYIAQLSPDGGQEIAQFQTPDTLRVRDLIETPEGDILFLSVGQGAVYRLEP